MAHKYNVGAYPFAGAFEHEGRDKTPKDHVLSGGAELMQLLEGQEAIVQQNVITRVAELASKGITPRVNAVRTMIIQEVRDHS
jgi:hypothetical protein